MTEYWNRDESQLGSMNALTMLREAGVKTVGDLRALIRLKADQPAALEQQQARCFACTRIELAAARKALAEAERLRRACDVHGHYYSCLPAFDAAMAEVRKGEG